MDSANFAIRGFSEVRQEDFEYHSLGDALSLSQAYGALITRAKRTPREGAGRLPVLLLETWASYPTGHLPLLVGTLRQFFGEEGKEFRPCSRS
jgi:hypothetical protein